MLVKNLTNVSFATKIVNYITLICNIRMNKSGPGFMEVVSYFAGINVRRSSTLLWQIYTFASFDGQIKLLKSKSNFLIVRWSRKFGNIYPCVYSRLRDRQVNLCPMKNSSKKELKREILLRRKSTFFYNRYYIIEKKVRNKDSN